MNGLNACVVSITVARTKAAATATALGAVMVRDQSHVCGHIQVTKASGFYGTVQPNAEVRLVDRKLAHARMGNGA